MSLGTIIIPRAEVKVGGVALYIAAAYHFTTSQAKARREEATKAQK